MNRRTVVTTIGPTTTVVLVSLAAVSDLREYGMSPWSTVVDLAVGLAFVVVAAAAPGPLSGRVAFAAVGGAWLLGSTLIAARTWHQAVLAFALLDVGRPRRSVGRTLAAGVAATVALAASLLLGQLAVAAVFAAVGLASLAAWGWIGRRTAGWAFWYPAVAATVVAAVLAVSWLYARQSGFNPGLALLTYEAVLLSVAAAFGPAVRTLRRGHQRLADRALSGRPAEGLGGFAAVLGETLGDPGVRVYPWTDGRFVDNEGAAATGGGWLTVDDPTDPGNPLAAVESRGAWRDDPSTVTAVMAAVRLAVTHQRLLEEERARLTELEASRARIVAAADRERARAAAALHERVDMPLRVAESRLAAVRSTVREPGAAATVNIAVHELTAAIREIADLVAGVPPADLGDGRLREAFESLARRSALPVTVSVEDGAPGTPAAGAALYYVAAEALTNAVKHAGATRVTIAVRRVGDATVTTVTDDGRGCADPHGSGLQGLADRLATFGGRLRVDSPPGAGTTVTATIPELAET
jgi:signal transduction histidine kinase